MTMERPTALVLFFNNHPRCLDIEAVGIFVERRSYVRQCGRTK